MNLAWFKPRGYRHFDRGVCPVFAQKSMQPEFVSSHPFSPLIKRIKEERRYKKVKPSDQNRTIVTKDRTIMYASHRDACILSYYASVLAELLDQYYSGSQLNSDVLAYRKLSKSNYNFSADSFKFACENSPVTILAYDVTGFFDNLDHRHLKRRLCHILGVSSLSDDWYAVFRFVTKFTYVELSDLKSHPLFGERLKGAHEAVIGTVAELKREGVSFHVNPHPGKGIPQGTPISSALSNLYMIEFDQIMSEYCRELGAQYRRYSDDILVICRPSDADIIEQKVCDLIKYEQLELSAAKTERTEFDSNSNTPCSGRAAQYLGFSLYQSGPAIRAGSMSRQWRKMRRAFKRTRKVAEAEIASGRATKVFTKKLRRRFTPLEFRNFSSYGRRSAHAFSGDEKISQQIRRFEREVDRQLQSLKELNISPPDDTQGS